MARYILIDNQSGYIFADSADLNGTIFAGTPTEFAAVFDASTGEPGRSYDMTTIYDLADNETGYHVYRADVNGSEAVPVIEDGQDAEMIAAVVRDCEYVTTLRCVGPQD